MDIDFLLWLQGLRAAVAPGVEHFFVTVSAVAINPVFLVLPFLVLWCVDKARGTLAIMSFSIGNLANQFVKNTVCAYRPWVRDARIAPSEAALPGATGYSFPSGHTLTAATVVGGLGWAFRRLVWPAVLAALFVVAVAFSRVFLGCHTPQDVVCALAEACVFIALTQALLRWVDQAPGRDLTVLVVGLVAVVAFLVYVTVKPYPMDYADGKLLVDPTAMTVDCYKAGGVFTGFVVGWFMERRLVAFTTDGIGARERAIRAVVGVVCVLAFHVLLGKAAMALPGPFAGPFVRHCLTFLAGTFVAPAIFSAIERRLPREAAA